MTTLAKERTTRKTSKKERSMAFTARKDRPGRPQKRERVLVEFPPSLLKRADEAAIRMEKNRSELIRTAVEKLLDAEERRRFEMELAAAYAANSELSLDITKEFESIDREGF